MVTLEELEQYNKLGTEVSKASGKFFDLLNDKSYILSRLKSRAAIKDANKKAEMIRNNPDMDIVFNGNDVFVKELDLVGLQARAEQRRLLKMIKQEENFENIVQNAYCELEHVEECSDEPVDPDWWTRFQNYAEDISNEEMQFVWGKILAEEIKKPSSVSLRTLETVRNLSSKEALVFQKLLPLIFSDDNYGYIYNNDELLRKYNISFSDFSLLEDCGLLSLKKDIGFNTILKGHSCFDLESKNYTISIVNGTFEDENINVLMYRLTTVGYELLKIIDYNTNLEYVIEMAKSIFDSNTNLDVKLSLKSTRKYPQGNILRIFTKHSSNDVEDIIKILKSDFGENFEELF